MADKKNKFLPVGQEPYPDDSPILVLWDDDMGWLVEAVTDGEYEVENFPFPWLGVNEINEEPDWELAYKLAKERNVRIRYYQRSTKTK